jgi:hypothetical protein
MAADSFHSFARDHRSRRRRSRHPPMQDRLLGDTGRFVGMTTFGASAPYSAL